MGERMPRTPVLEQVDAAQLELVLGVIDAVLGERVVAAALFGSATAGGLHPDSDLDVLVIVGSPLVDGDAERLVEGLLPISGRRAARPGRPVELSVVARDDVVPWRFPPRRQVQYGEWLRDEATAGVIAPPAVDPDLAILLRQALNSHVPLRGPDLAAVLDPVPDDDVQRALDLTLPALLDDLVGDERNVLLTLARMWATNRTGVIMPKDAAADWAIARLGEEREARETRDAMDAPDSSDASDASDEAATSASLALARDAYLGLVVDDWSSRAAEAVVAARLLAARVCGR